MVHLHYETLALGLGLDLISSITLIGNVFSDIDTFADINEIVEINN